MRQRLNVVAIIHNTNDEILLCKQTKDGVYPGQWAIPGGGVEVGEGLHEALAREIKEEVNLEVSQIEPFTFGDDIRDKKKDGSVETLHMIYLLFDCLVVNPRTLVLNEEFESSEWVSVAKLATYDLNSATIKTFRQKGWL
jgi:nucleoside triphosphatase